MSFIHFLQHDPAGTNPAAPPTGGVGAAEPETVRRIAGRLSELDPLRAAFLAGVGYCLARVVASDLDVTDGERGAMVEQIEAFAGVPAEEAALIVDLAVHEAMAGAGTDDFYVTQRVRALPCSTVTCWRSVAVQSPTTWFVPLSSIDFGTCSAIEWTA